MKVLVVLVLLFGVALSRPARTFSNSDSDSSEEVMRRPASSLRKGTLFPHIRGALEQIFKAGADLEENTEPTDEEKQQEAAAEDSTDSKDSEEDDDTEEEESEEEEDDDSSDNSESGESTTEAPAEPTSVMVTEEPTIAPIMPTIVTDPDQGRGDSLGGYPGEYKSIYEEDKSYNKIPSPYKSYEYVEEGKKSAYDMTHGNDVDKSLMVYKVQALQVHHDYMEEDTSTPEVDGQSLDNSVVAPEELEPRQASLPAEEEEETTANSDSNSDSGSSSTPEEEEEDSASASQDDDDESQSNEESNQSDESDESDSDEQGAGPEPSTDAPIVITAK